MILDRLLVGSPPSPARQHRNVRADGVETRAVEATDTPLVTDGDELPGKVLEHGGDRRPQSVRFPEGDESLACHAQNAGCSLREPQAPFPILAGVHEEVKPRILECDEAAVRELDERAVGNDAD